MSHKSGIYLVSEQACLIPGSGANKHIYAGFNELSKNFDLKMILFCDPPKHTPGKLSSSGIITKDNYFNRWKNIIKSTLKWVYLLIKNHIYLISYIKKIKAVNPDFIYERSNYLNYNGLLISKWLKIPHFYEVNGILSEDHKKYFPDFLSKIAFWLEKKSYHKSYGFYVGGLNEYFNIPIGKFAVIQNGIDEEYLHKFREEQEVPADKLNLTFIGHAMAHHRLDILVDALNLLSRPERFRIHLIGSNLEAIKGKINPEVEVIDYGTLDHNQISKVMQKINVGVIPYALPYFSHVKAFMYGASRLLIMLPETRNFKSIFSSEEVIFINNDDPLDFSRKLEMLLDNPEIIKDYRNRIYSKVAEKFTWEKIYEEVAVIIKSKLENPNS